MRERQLDSTIRTEPKVQALFRANQREDRARAPAAAASVDRLRGSQRASWLDPLQPHTGATRAGFASITLTDLAPVIRGSAGCRETRWTRTKLVPADKAEGRLRRDRKFTGPHRK
jgi:hypothetical protein